MSEPALTETATFDDGSFVRTAIVVPTVEQNFNGSTSFDVINDKGERACIINAFLYYSEKTGELRQVIVDVCDADEKFEINRAMTFNNGQRESIPAKVVVSAHFENPDES